jgi:hypothetical protein
MSAPDYMKLRAKLWLGQRINEARAQHKEAGMSNRDFQSWLQALACETRVSVTTLRNWACWAGKPSPVDAYDRHLAVAREGARWRRLMRKYPARMQRPRRSNLIIAGQPQRL